MDISLLVNSQALHSAATPSLTPFSILNGAPFPHAVHHLQLRIDYLADQLIRFGRQHRSLRVLLQHLYSGLVH